LQQRASRGGSWEGASVKRNGWPESVGGRQHNLDQRAPDLTWELGE